MKNLDLNAMGVVEMDASEVKTVDGGQRYFIDGLEFYSETSFSLALLVLFGIHPNS